MRAHVCVCVLFVYFTYECYSDAIQHVGIMQAVGAVLPVAGDVDAGLPLVDRQVVVVPVDGHITFYPTLGLLPITLQIL